MRRILTTVLAVMMICTASLSEPFTFSKANAGWGADEFSCTAPGWYWQGGQCVPDDLGQEIIVYGVNGFDQTFFTMYILPMYNMGYADYTYLPAETEQRETELNRRRRIHDCAVRNLAAGMRADIPGLQTQLEVTFEYNGVRARFDIVESMGGIPTGVTEVKTVLDFEGSAEDLLVRNQPIVAEGIRNGLAVPYGANAVSAGFVPGQAIGRNLPMSVVALPVTPGCEGE